MAEIEIEIDGQKLTAKPNQTVIQVADEAGIYIPRFCYHKHLSVPANCRMCLVEVEKSPKPLPACATPVAAGMKVFTKSTKSLLAQRAVMEFLLINHPLDCPICDQGGECELQDLAMGYGSSHSDYCESKRAVADENLGPLIATEMTRCILCSRCIRFGEEIAGVRELGMTFRGEHEEVSTFVESAMTSEVSGNIIDICPVGALTSKPFRFAARAWELDQAPSISPHDCVGSNLNVHTRYGKVMRVVAREQPSINQTWISDRDRFSYTGLYHPDRLENPIVKTDGRWQVVDWHEAFTEAASRLTTVIAEFGIDKVGALASPNSTVEEFYLLQKIVRGLGSPHIDHRLREMDTQDQHTLPLFPGLGAPITELAQCQSILLIGANVQKEQPLVALQIRQAALLGATVSVINSVDYSFNFKVTNKKIVAPRSIPTALAALLKALDSPVSLPTAEEVAVDDTVKALAQQLRGEQKRFIVLGAQALQHTHASLIRYLAQAVATATGAKLGLLTQGANSAGGWLAGALPHRHAGGGPINHVGLDAYAMLAKPRKAYVLLNVEPEYDCANAMVATEALKQAKLVMGLSMYQNPTLEAHADIILPIAPFTETSGTFVNTAGEWQSFKGLAKSFAESRPAWKVLRVLGNFLKLEGFDYESSEEIAQEVKHQIDKMSGALLPSAIHAAPEQGPLSTSVSALSRIGEIPIYATDSLVRRAAPLQEAQRIMEGDMACVRLHPDTAAKLKIQEGDTVKVKQHTGSAHLPVVLDARIAVDAAWIAGGIAAARELGDLFGEVEIEKG